jgi:F5/8 type C domain/Right handed beta helix region
MTYRTRGRAVCISVVLGIAASVTSVVALAQAPNRAGLYVPPAPSYIHDPSETPVALEFGLTSLARIQRQLDAARAAHPDSPIVLTLTGTYAVSDAPLTLPSKTSLVLYGTLRADESATASSLIAIVGRREVSVAGGLLDGRGVSLSGIRVEGSAKVNIDAVTISNTGGDGIVLNGRGNDVWNSGSAITRCEIIGAGGNGVTVGSIPQAIVLDNFVRGAGGAGFQVSAAHASIVNNVSRANDVGAIVTANDNLISDNELRANRNGGLRLTGSSSGTAVLRNAMIDNAGFGIDLDGSNNLVYLNRLRNTIDLIDRAPANWVVARETPLQAPISRYFYPPTVDNRHAEPIVNGRNRTDVAVDSSIFPTISAVQQVYDAARQQHPDDVIVLTLTGDFTVDASPLLLQSRTALLLDGTITVPATLGVDAIRAANPSEFISVSGGTLDLGGRSREGVFFPSTTMAYVEGVTVLRGGERDVRAGRGMIHFQSGGGYAIVRGNTVDTCGGRGIWTQNSNTRFVALENHVSNCNQDAVDFDSSTRNSVAIDNISVDNVRYGVFIEQSASLNKAYGNFATTRGLPSPIPGRGVNIYNNATSAGVRAVTDKNTAFSNVTDLIANGIRVGSIATDSDRVGVAETRHSFLFNNVVTNIRVDGILFDTQFPRSIENYFSQTVLSGNGRDLRYVPDPNPDPALRATPPEFFNPPPAFNLALRQPATASSSAPDSSPGAAVDGLAYTSWVAGSEDRAWLTIDLGGSVSFGRVMLKQTAADVIARIVLQISDDGASFSDLPGTARKIVMNRDVNNVRFEPVVARFLRVNIMELRGGPVGFEEVSVHPR